MEPAALLSGLLVFASTGETLDTFRWQARPILVFAAKDDPRLGKQVAAFAGVANALRERRNVIVVDTNAVSALRARFSPDGFTVILVGLDGGEKARENRVVPGNVFEDRIDAMPMRRREMERRQ